MFPGWIEPGLFEDSAPKSTGQVRFCESSAGAVINFVLPSFGAATGVKCGLVRASTWKCSAVS